MRWASDWSGSKYRHKNVAEMHGDKLWRKCTETNCGGNARRQIVAEMHDKETRSAKRKDTDRKKVRIL